MLNRLGEEIGIVARRLSGVYGINFRDPEEFARSLPTTRGAQMADRLGPMADIFAVNEATDF